MAGISCDLYIVSRLPTFAPVQCAIARVSPKQHIGWTVAIKIEKNPKNVVGTIVSKRWPCTWHLEAWESSTEVCLSKKSSRAEVIGNLKKKKKKTIWSCNTNGEKGSPHVSNPTKKWLQTAACAAANCNSPRQSGQANDCRAHKHSVLVPPLGPAACPRASRLRCPQNLSHGPWKVNALPSSSP